MKSTSKPRNHKSLAPKADFLRNESLEPFPILSFLRKSSCAPQDLLPPKPRFILSWPVVLSNKCHKCTWDQRLSLTW